LTVKKAFSDSDPFSLLINKPEKESRAFNLASWHLEGKPHIININNDTIHLII
jgi:hypothetical protein